MNKLVALFGLITLSSVLTSPLKEHPYRNLPALEQEEVHDEFGQFALRYVTAEGTVVSELGRLVPTPDGTGYVMIVEGGVSYVGDDDQVYITKYTAGLDGYHVEGNHLPNAPEVPKPEAEK